MNDAEKILKIIAESDAIVAKATGAPWWGESLVIHAHDTDYGPHVCNCERGNDNDAENADFIAHARNTIEPTNAALKIAVEALERAYVVCHGNDPAVAEWADKTLRAMLAELEKKS